MKSIFSEWLLFNAKWAILFSYIMAIFQLDDDDDDDYVCFVLAQHAL